MHNFIATFVGTDFFVGIPSTSDGSSPISDIIIGTPFNAADYVVESSTREIQSGTVTSRVRTLVRLSDAQSNIVRGSGFSERMKGFRVRATKKTRFMF